MVLRKYYHTQKLQAYDWRGLELEFRANSISQIPKLAESNILV